MIIDSITIFGLNCQNCHDQHECVDLGLPSGMLWATCNIGADTPEEAGLYFAWGETQGYTSGQVGTDKYFSWGDEGYPNDYKFGPVDWDDRTNYGMTKYNRTDGKTVLDPEDDAATVNWGDGWRMPTEAEFDELTANTTSAWTQVDGVNGMLLTSTANTNTLFFPAVGDAGNGGMYDDGNYGEYWSVSLCVEDVHDAWRFGFVDGDSVVFSNNRVCGCSVRPVRI